MVRDDSIMMSMKELERLHVIRQVMEQRLTSVQAGTLVQRPSHKTGHFYYRGKRRFLLWRDRRLASLDIISPRPLDSPMLFC